ncbi:MAG: hypothetical protein KAH56_12275 [Candidatus Krumholzibacteria bacterium]|nr:hypothetical protein [Candidatus Krumholzibacteria bacterium]
MAGTGKKWFIGCGIGCGLMVLITAGIGTVGFFSFKGLKDRTDRIEVTYNRMDAEYGQPSEFTPQIDGRIPADRMGIFLAVRNDVQPVQQEVSGLFRTLDGTDGAGWMAKAKAGMKFIPSLLVFIEERNQIMLDHGMGVGEYQYIYALAYYGLLGKNLSDGPGFTVASDEDQDEENWRWEVNAGERDDEEEIREKREREVRRFVNRVQSQVLANQLVALDAHAGHLDGLDFDVWREEVAAEAAAMARESLRLLWEEGLPVQTRESLEPYRDQLDATYDEMTSILEMGLVKHH